MKPNNQESDVLFPPVGIAHITRDISDLAQSRIKDQSGFELSCSMQPNSNPHIGSLVTLMTVFALGEHFSEKFGIPAQVTFDQLENAPAETLIINGNAYTRSLSDITIDDVTRADKHMVAISSILDDLSARTQIQWRIRPYSELQAKPIFRQMLLKILKDYSNFKEIFSPSEQYLRIRFPCPNCLLSDKASISVVVESISNDMAVLSSICPNHGRYEIRLSLETNDLIDTNAPIRSVLKACVMVDENRRRNYASFITNGNDWSGVWLQRIYSEGMAALGYNHFDIPLQFFTPMILDWSGAKLSKTLYVQSNAYDYLPPVISDTSSMVGQSQSFQNLWNEVRGWVKDPRKFFRNYSVAYMKQVLEIE
jgi:hypothetical protein